MHPLDLQQAWGATAQIQVMGHRLSAFVVTGSILYTIMVYGVKAPPITGVYHFHWALSSHDCNGIKILSGLNLIWCLWEISEAYFLIQVLMLQGLSRMHSGVRRLDALWRISKQLCRLNRRATIILLRSCMRAVPMSGRFPVNDNGCKECSTKLFEEN